MTAVSCALVSVSQIASVYPLAIINVLGNVLTNVSLGKVAVSFTHTVKVRLKMTQHLLKPAAEPSAGLDESSHRSR